MTPHIKRWLTAILAVPLLFAVIYLGSREIFFLLVLLLTVGGVSEYIAIAFERGFIREKGTVYAAGILLPLAAFAGGPEPLIAATTLSFIAAFIIFLGGLKDQSFDVAPLFKVVFGFLYVPLMMSHMILLRDSQNGVLWIFFMIILAFSGDITAFYAGRNFGKVKLMPHVSAGKTVEGTLGSVVGSLAGCAVFKIYLLPEVPMAHVLILGFFGNVIGELGDLCESVLKRWAGVKDSGFIFPGHGGILDRLDCILFIAPFLYYYRTNIIG